MSIIDIKWQILPSKLVYMFGGLAVLLNVSNVLIYKDAYTLLNSLVGGTILFGVFWCIYQISSGKWIGGGDVRLLGMMGILLGWQNGILAVIGASYLATFVVLGLVIIKKYKKGMRISFGPFLLVGTYFAFLFGDSIISAYKSFSGL